MPSVASSRASARLSGQFLTAIEAGLMSHEFFVETSHNPFDGRRFSTAIVQAFSEFRQGSVGAVSASSPLRPSVYRHY
jgi:hypothetical protein